MKIRTKLFFAFILTAGLSAVLATFSAIFSISEKYEEMAVEETVSVRKAAESFFHDNLGDLTRKAAFLSELGEIVDNLDNPGDLSLALDRKNFFLYNTDIKVVDAEARILASYTAAAEPFLKQEDIPKLPFFAEGNDPLLRDGGVFKIKNRLCILVKSPIVDPASFDIKGYIIFELYLNSEFADQLKEKAKGEIIIIAGQKKMASTFQDSNGERVFPEIRRLDNQQTAHLKFQETNFLIDRFPVVDYYENQVGEIVVAVNVQDIIVAKKHGIQNILLVLGLVVVIVVVFSIFVGAKLTNSILRLSTGAEALTKGDFDVRLEVRSKDEIGQLTRVFNKMTESLKTQRDEILALKQYFEKIIDNSPSAIIICDVVSHAITINPAAERMFGITADEIKGREVFDLISLPLSLQADFYQVILSGNPISYDSYRLTMPDKSEKIFRLTFYEVAIKGSISVAIQIQDITESFKLEEELTHAQKLGTLGEVLGRFTHEFNNLMTGIIGHISLLVRKTDAKDGNYKRLLAIEDLASKARNLGKNVLSFSRKGTMEREAVEIVHLVDSVLHLVEKTVFKGIDIKRNYNGSSFYALTNPEKLSLALLNLLINAKDALKDVKRNHNVISISVDRREAETGDKFLEITVADNGSGIEEDIQERIFDPYFTTKGKMGTGLGLATVKDIVEKSGGTIEVSSVVGEGTSFVIRFLEAEAGSKMPGA